MLNALHAPRADHKFILGPEEVVVMAKVHPTAHVSIEQLSRAMDDFDRRIRAAMPVVAGRVYRRYSKPLRRNFKNRS
jgi:hypothetical protein